MSAILNFDATQVAPQESFSPLPAGEYLVMVTNTELKQTKAGTGSYLSVDLQIIEGEYEGRKIWDNITLQNPNQTAVNIGQKQLSSLCHATGELHVQDSEQLHDKLVIAVVGVRPAKGDYDASNNVKAYKAANKQAPVQAAPQQAPAPAPAAQPAMQQAQPAQSAAPATPPWQQQ